MEEENEKEEEGEEEEEDEEWAKGVSGGWPWAELMVKLFGGTKGN